MPQIDVSNIYHQIMLLFISIIVGFVIGLEREYRNKFAGLRTFILISFGSCLFTILSLSIGSMDRIASNIVTGIGFLGAGVIFKEDNKITGITTATSIWATASIGMCVGYGNLILALTGTVIVLIVLHLLIKVQQVIDSKHKVKVYKVGVLKIGDLEIIEKMFKESGLKVETLNLEKSNDMITSVWSVGGTIVKQEKLERSLIANPIVKNCLS